MHHARALPTFSTVLLILNAQAPISCSMPGSSRSSGVSGCNESWCTWPCYNHGHDSYFSLSFDLHTIAIHAAKRCLCCSFLHAATTGMCRCSIDRPSVAAPMAIHPCQEVSLELWPEHVEDEWLVHEIIITWDCGYIRHELGDVKGHSSLDLSRQ